MTDNAKRVAKIADGVLSIAEIAEIVGMSRSGVKKICARHNLPTRPCGAMPGDKNHQFVSGRRVGKDGYVIVTAPKDHPYAKKRPNRNQKMMYEHRLVMEQKLGRYLLPEEVVDHIDGLTLHNAPENLRLFENNAEHLKSTIAGRGPLKHSKSGRANIGRRTDLGSTLQRVDTHHHQRKSGDIRLRQILLAALKLGIDSPYLLGTHRHLEKIGIDPSSRSSLERALHELDQRYAEALDR